MACAHSFDKTVSPLGGRAWLSWALAAPATCQSPQRLFNPVRNWRSIIARKNDVAIAIGPRPIAPDLHPILITVQDYIRGSAANTGRYDLERFYRLEPGKCWAHRWASLGICPR